MFIHIYLLFFSQLISFFVPYEKSMEVEIEELTSIRLGDQLGQLKRAYEAFEYIGELKEIESITFGASSKKNVEENLVSIYRNIYWL